MKKVLFVPALALVLAACERETSAEATAEFCEQLRELHTALAGLATLPPTATVGDLRQARAQVADELEDVREEGAELREVRIDDLEAAHDRLEDAINDVPDEATIEQAAAAIRPEAEAYLAEVSRLNGSVNCPGL